MSGEKRPPFICGAVVDRYRNLRNGKRKWVGQILMFNPEKVVIAEVYGSTIKEMRARKRAVEKAMKELSEAHE